MGVEGRNFRGKRIFSVMEMGFVRGVIFNR